MSNTPVYTNKWFHGLKSNFELFTPRFRDRPVRGLEIGSFEGQSSNWMVENWCTHPDSRLACIDPFTGSVENSAEEVDKLYERFMFNIQDNAHKIDVMRDVSDFALPRLLATGERFDFIYIDGDHHNFAVLHDAILCDKMLVSGGLLAFDDYGWELHQPSSYRPRDAIDYFINISQRYRVDVVNYQVFATKMS